MVVTCKVCGAVMRPDHGIIHPDEQTGVIWWQCPCGRRVRERYSIEENRIVTLSAVEVS